MVKNLYFALTVTSNQINCIELHTSTECEADAENSLQLGKHGNG